jgi:hypothetical protein
MARILVVDERQDQSVLDGHVRPVTFDDKHDLQQILERLGWALGSAIKEARLLQDTAARQRVRSPEIATSQPETHSV